MAAETYCDCEQLNVIEAAGLQDIFSTRMTTEPVGPIHVRLIWYVQKTTSDGRQIQMPVASIVTPTTTVMMAANKMAAAHTLARTDFVGMPLGSG